MEIVIKGTPKEIADITGATVTSAEYIKKQIELLSEASERCLKTNAMSELAELTLAMAEITRH